MGNPYDAPAPGPLLAEESRRPIGVSILAILTTILGFVLLAAFIVCVVNWRENNELMLRRRMAPSIFWCFVSTSVVIAFATAVGMWRGRKWAWWIACCGLVLYVLGNFGNAAMVNLSHGAPSFATFLSVNSLKFILRGVFFVIVLEYWLRTKVRKFFQVEQTGCIKAVVLSAVCGIGITAIITIVLQTIFLLRER